MTEYIQALVTFLMAVPFVYMLVDVARELTAKAVRIRHTDNPKRR